eukprot:SAG22_NODE_1528_length_4218_cov_30.416363_3_plen_92_part_00
MAPDQGHACMDGPCRAQGRRRQLELVGLVLRDVWRWDAVAIVFCELHKTVEGSGRHGRNVLSLVVMASVNDFTVSQRRPRTGAASQHEPTP